MKIEIDRSALQVETNSFALTLVFPWGELPNWCDFPDDKRFGWTADGDVGTPSHETRFSFGRPLYVFARKQSSRAWAI